MKVLRSELIKMTTVKSPIWCAILVLVLGVGVAGLFAWVARYAQEDSNSEVGPPPVALGVSDALLGVSGFGAMVLAVLGALAITSEYRFGLIRTTFQAIPNRTLVLTAKALVYGIFGAVIAGIASVAALLVARVVAGSDLARGLELGADGTWRQLLGVPVYAFLMVVLAVGAGTILRQAAAAIALLLLWPLVLEGLVPLFGSVGRDIAPFLPFANANNFLGAATGVDFHWGPWGSLAYFVAVVAAVFIGAIVLVNSRDA